MSTWKEQKWWVKGYIYFFIIVGCVVISGYETEYSKETKSIKRQKEEIKWEADVPERRRIEEKRRRIEEKRQQKLAEEKKEQICKVVDSDNRIVEIKFRQYIIDNQNYLATDFGIVFSGCSSFTGVSLYEGNKWAMCSGWSSEKNAIAVYRGLMLEFRGRSFWKFYGIYIKTGDKTFKLKTLYMNYGGGGISKTYGINKIIIVDNFLPQNLDLSTANHLEGYLKNIEKEEKEEKKEKENWQRRKRKWNDAAFRAIARAKTRRLKNPNCSIEDFITSDMILNDYDWNKATEYPREYFDKQFFEEIDNKTYREILGLEP